MAPKRPRRGYGSLEYHNKPRANRSCGDAKDERSVRGIDPWPAVARWTDAAAGLRCFTLVAIGLVAVAFRVGLPRAEHPLPKGANSYTRGGSQSLIVVRSGFIAETEDNAVGYRYQRPSPKKAILDGVPQQEGLSPLGFTALNPYHIRDGKPALDYPWLKDVKLIEPFRETTLSVTSPREGFEYRWAIHAPGQAERSVEASGKKAAVVCTVLDDNMLTLEEVDEETGVVVRRLEEEVMVKYVRREIRTLMDEEREELLDAVRT